MTTNDFKNATIEHLAPNQTIVHISNTTILYSYSSVIVVINHNKEVFLGPDWKHSATTSKYRSQFLNESTTETQAKLDNGTYTLLQ